MNSPSQRYNQASRCAQRAGKVVRGHREGGVYWTLGQYDTVIILDAPDETALTAFGLEFGKAGNHRTQTLRAFSQTEMGAVLNKVT